jgi:DinB superfamily
MVRYAKGAEVALLDPAELSERLAAVLREAMPWLVTISEAEASVPEREGKWSAKQVIGHLIDSAVNNLGRIVRLQIEAGQSLPGYEQMAWVGLQHYAEREWAQVLALWFALNEHVAWTIGHVEQASLANRGVVAGEPLTLGFLIEDYVAHMEHHLRTMRLWLGTTGDAPV